MESSDCLARALRLLSGRSHFRRQLAEKLRSRGFDELEVESTLERLVELGYLDEERTAEEYVRTRLRRGPMGRRRMRSELEKRGAESSAIDVALERTYEPGDDLLLARDAAKRWDVRRSPGRDLDDPDSGAAEALGRHLGRLGFQTGTVLRVMDEMRSGAGSDEPV